jgi:flavodoxin
VKAIVVYESLWGNTAEVARAIAEGIGGGTRAVSTSEATAAALAGADLVVAGAPILGFRLPTDDMRRSVLTTERRAPRPADLSHPSMRAWLEGLPAGHGRFATFETGLWWSPGGATKSIAEKMAAVGYEEVFKGRRFVVRGRYGPLRDGEVEKARSWGAELAKTLG